MLKFSYISAIYLSFLLWHYIDVETSNVFPMFWNDLSFEVAFGTRSNFTIRSTLKFHTDLAGHTLSRVVNNDVCVRQVSHLKQPYLSRFAIHIYIYTYFVSRHLMICALHSSSFFRPDCCSKSSLKFATHAKDLRARNLALNKKIPSPHPPFCNQAQQKS